MPLHCVAFKAMMLFTIATGLLFIAAFSGLGHCKEYYVSASSTLECTGNLQPCHSLLFYLNDSQQYFVDDSIFYFMEGTHILDGHELHLLAIRDVNNLTLKGLDYKLEDGFHETVRQSTVVITCQESSSGILFFNSSLVSIIGIKIINCGGSLPINVADTILPFESLYTNFDFIDHSFALAIIHSNTITMQDVSVQNSTNYGLFCINALNINVSYSSFAGNNLAGHENCTVNSCVGGNALLVYASLENCTNQFNVYSVNVYNSNFSFGYDDGVYTLESASGLSFVMIQGDNYGVDVRLDSVILYGNTGILSGNFRYIVSKAYSYHSLIVSNCKSLYGNKIYPIPNVGELHILPHSIFTIWFGFRHDINSCFQDKPIVSNFPLHIFNSQFLHNKAPNNAGLAVQGNMNYSNNNPLIIESCVMSNNIGFNGANLFIELSGASVTVKNTNVTYSQTHATDMHSTVGGSVPSAFCIHKSTSVTLENVRIAQNSISGLMLLNAEVKFLGYNIFSENSAHAGGGIFFSGGSTIFLNLNSSTKLVFKHNRATSKGGAIFIDTASSLVQNSCFIQPTDREINISSNVSLIFEGNTANKAGSAVYGGNTETCEILTVSHNRIIVINGTNIFNSIFEYYDQSGSSVISSDPVYLYFCNNNTVDMSVESLNVSVLPGQLKDIDIVLVGEGGGIVPGNIIIKEQNIEFGRIMTTSENCTTMYYTPTINENNTLPNVQEVTFAIERHKASTKKVHFYIQECPFGFSLSHKSLRCDCNKYIKYGANITCDAVTKSFYHEGDTWMGYMQEEGCFVVYSGCNYGHHCKTSGVNFTLETVDKQCTLNKSGLLCGKCAEGLSLMFGSDRCGECTNYSLFLLIPFALAGIILIAFITAFDLTVSTGSMNGLLFYANIVKINETDFLRNVSVLDVFISWLNLDLGIETCFYNGLTSYSKTWLQFAFPAYLWFLMILIIYLCRHSVRLSKLMGRHSISVLATILLLSFTKIIRTCIQVLKPDIISCGSKHIIGWYFDPTWYWSDRWIMVVATIFFFFLASLYTLFLLCSRFIEKYISRCRCCKCWVKLKPLFDAYNGPYEDKHRVWTALLLYIRIIYAVVVVSAGKAQIIFLITTIGILLGIVATTKGPYQKKYNNYLECFHYVNLIFLAAINDTKINPKAWYICSYISVSLVVLVFFCIVIYCFTQMKIYKEIKSQIMKMPRVARKISQRQKHLRSLRVPFVDDRHVVTHDMENMVTVELYDEDGDFVTRRRETLIREDLID